MSRSKRSDTCDGIKPQGNRTSATDGDVAPAGTKLLAMLRAKLWAEAVLPPLPPRPLLEQLLPAPPKG